MPPPSSYHQDEMSHGLTRILGKTMRRFKDIIVSSLCVEQCRFCGREIALDRYRQAERPDSSLLPEAAFTALTEKSYARVLDKNESDRKEHTVVPHSVHQISSRVFSFLAVFIRPAKTLTKELAEVSLAATHSKLVPPALIYFSRHPLMSPRLSQCLCDLCWDDIEIDLPLLGFCQLASSDQQTQQTLPVASGVAYEGKIKELIRTFKYKHDASLAADLASLMSIGWSALSDYMPASQLLLVPVPLHKKRKSARGYNQAELLAKELATILAIKIDNRALQRIKSTKQQQLLGKKERSENVRNAFLGDRRRLQGRTVVLIDDVCTSGSTLVACAEEVLKCGAKSVVALTIARALPHSM